MVNKRELTEDGLEKNFATNTLGKSKLCFLNYALQKLIRYRLCHRRIRKTWTNMLGSWLITFSLSILYLLYFSKHCLFMFFVLCLLIFSFTISLGLKAIAVDTLLGSGELVLRLKNINTTTVREPPARVDEGTMIKQEEP